MAMHPHSAPRAGRNRGNPRLSQRGGVQKRGQHTTRVDRDGDLDMDAHGAGRGRGRGDRRRHTSTPPRNGVRLDSAAAQQSIFRQVGGKDFTARGRGTHPRQGNASGTRQNNSAKGLDQIIIRGLQQSKAALNARGGLDDLIRWLEKKAHGPQGQAVKVKKSRRDGNDVIISVRPEDTASIVRLNGYTFAGASLTVESYSIGDTQQSHKASINHTTFSPAALEVKELLQNTLNRRYNPDLKLLDLSKLVEDSDLAQTGLLDGNNRISRLFQALMVVCDESFQDEQQKNDAIVSVSLANNNLINLEPVVKLASTFPEIKNLDLSNNQFRNVHALDKWKFKLPALEHLVITGNPLEKEDPTYHASLCSRYLNLRRIDTTPGLPTQTFKPRRSPRINMPIARPAFRDDTDISQNFIIKFFPTFDTDRDSLLNEYYDSRSQFSMNVNSQAPREQTSTATPASWDQYIKNSRNLTKISHTKARMNRLTEGREKIRALWNTIPATRHADLKREPEKWCIECHHIIGVPDKNICAGVGGLIIMAHGQFMQEDGVMRSFDRTIILGPGSGSGGIRVQSDMLTLRAYGGFMAWIPNSTPEGNPIASNGVPHPGMSGQAGQNPLPFGQQHTQPNPNMPWNSIPPQSPFAPSNPIQPNPLKMPSTPPPLPEGFGQVIAGKTTEQLQNEALIMELTSRTHMTIEYSEMCLHENAWNLENAYRAFEAAKAKGSIPMEAFLPY